MYYREWRAKCSVNFESGEVLTRSGSKIYKQYFRTCCIRISRNVRVAGELRQFAIEYTARACICDSKSAQSTSRTKGNGGGTVGGRAPHSGRRASKDHAHDTNRREFPVRK